MSYVCQGSGTKITMASSVSQLQLLQHMKSRTVIESIHHLGTYHQFTTVEKFPLMLFEQASDASIAVAKQIKTLIEAKAAANKTCVLGLATGSTPVGVYRELIRYHKEEGLSFKNVVTFNLDEYYPIAHDNEESYHQFMVNNLFKHIDIPKENIHMPSGSIPKGEVEDFCEQYEEKIVEAGGIDLQILGIGRTGHIGFNEPPSSKSSITRMVHLHRITRVDNSGGFNGEENVPRHAITMGIQTIRNAKKVILMAWGENKAKIVQKTIEGPTTTDIPATLLADHKDLMMYIDRPASAQLSRFVRPWTIRGDIEDPEIHFDQYWCLKAVTWLSKVVNKPILRLTYDDYEDNSLAHLLATVGNSKAEAVNLYTYKLIEGKITGWPLGVKPQGRMSWIEGKESLVKKRIMIFSPHPDDDVICMGGTMQKLIRQGHEVSVVYMTSGSFAVFDHEALKYLDFVMNFAVQNELQSFEEILGLYKESTEFIDNKKAGERDSKLLQSVKKIIRRSEAKLAAVHLGVNPKNVFCLDLPFYESGKSKKNLPSQADLDKIKDVITMKNPDYIFAAGDLTDPHGTHRVCLELLLSVLDAEKFNPENVLLYRGAWDEWEVELCDFIVPMSPMESEKKRESILKHQSQKDRPMFPGNDIREFWERAQQRNRGTAELLSKLGFVSYEACECFSSLLRLKDVFLF